MNDSYAAETKPAPLPMGALPKPIRDFVQHESSRRQCQPDYLAVTALCALSALVGNKVLIYPHKNTKPGWPANLWGALVGNEAGAGPAFYSALTPMRTLQREVHLANEQSCSRKLEHFYVNDSTAGELEELLIKKPDGLLLAPKELSGWLGTMSRQDEEAEDARAIYINGSEGYNNFKEEYTGSLAVVGPTSIHRITQFVEAAVSEDCFYDGLISRIQLMVWPDTLPRFKFQDLPLDSEIYTAYESCFLNFYALEDFRTAEFDTQAQEFFNAWEADVWSESKSVEATPLMRDYLQRSPRTVAALSLIFELIETGDTGDTWETSISTRSLFMALDLADYLKSHAARIYSINAPLTKTAAKPASHQVATSRL